MMHWVTVQPDTAFRQGLDFFSDAVSQLSAADWAQPSPCPDWRALDVLGHVGQATRFGTLMLLGARPDWSPVEPPGAAVEGVPGAWWAELADRARSAVAGADLAQEMDSPAGRRTVGDGLSFPAIDLYVHGWDIARAGGYDLVIPAAAIEFAHAVIDPAPAARIRNGRVFGAEQPAPPGATESAAFLAWTGRNPAWSPEP
jgi:uncharacterized protein (TIGR03086 family)